MRSHRFEFSRCSVVVSPLPLGISQQHGSRSVNVDFLDQDQKTKWGFDCLFTIQGHRHVLPNLANHVRVLLGRVMSLDLVKRVTHNQDLSYKPEHRSSAKQAGRVRYLNPSRL